MSRRKKTIDVTKTLIWANTQLRRTDESATREFKFGICSFIETILHETGNYAGFTFINLQNDKLAVDVNLDSPNYYDRRYLTLVLKNK
jgi:hypothetical protein